MSTIRITALDELAEVPADSDVFALEDISAGVTKKVTAAHVRSGLASNAGLSAEVAAREAHEAASNPHSGSASTTALNLVDVAVTTHVADTDNPHDVTATQAGAIPATSGAATQYVTAASETAAGISELATLTEAVTGTDTARVPTVAAARQAQISLMRDSLGKFPGVIPPSLNLFCGDATSDAAPAGTFTRSTTGTRIGQAGLIETVAAGSVRREWDAGGDLRGWLIEESRTNLIPYSVDFTQSYWIKTNCTVASAATVSPDGTTMGSKIIESSDSVASSHYMGGASASVTVPAGSVTFSFFAKVAERSTVQVYMVDTTGIIGTQATFNLSTEIVTGASGSIKSYGNGWYRCSYTATAAAGACYGRIFLRNATSSSYIGDGSSGIFIWGTQIEASSFPSSYIPTASTAVARSADVWAIALANDWFNTTTGTLFIAGDTAPGLPPSGDAQVLAMLDDGTSSNRIYIYISSTGVVYCAVSISGASVANITIGAIDNAMPFNIALSWSPSFIHVSFNGGVVIGATLSSSISVTTFRLGLSVSGSSLWDGHIRHLAYFPAALSDTQLQAITL